MQEASKAVKNSKVTREAMNAMASDVCDDLEVAIDGFLNGTPGNDETHDVLGFLAAVGALRRVQRKFDARIVKLLAKANKLIEERRESILRDVEPIMDPEFWVRDLDELGEEVDRASTPLTPNISYGDRIEQSFNGHHFVLSAFLRFDRYELVACELDRLDPEMAAEFRRVIRHDSEWLSKNIRRFERIGGYTETAYAIFAPEVSGLLAETTEKYRLLAEM